MVLRWLGSDAQGRKEGILGSYGVAELGGKKSREAHHVDQDSKPNVSNRDHEAAVASSLIAIRKRRGSSVSSTLSSPLPGFIRQYSTYDLDPADFLDLTGGEEKEKLEFPVLLLEYCPMGTMDAFVKAHPEMVDERLWVSWVGTLGSAGEWLEERGVVRE
jgi:hypothetical protein